MTEYFEIIPGKSIGPFQLGMTREQIDELKICPRMDLNNEAGTYYPLADIAVEEIQYFPSPGVNVYYDSSGTCHRLRAHFQYEPCPPVSTLCGHVTNGMEGSEVVSILRSIASDVELCYGSISSPSAGIRATKWEAGDEPIMCINVMPKKDSKPVEGT